jgi:hypothetical protein
MTNILPILGKTNKKIWHLARFVTAFGSNASQRGPQHRTGLDNQVAEEVIH